MLHDLANDGGFVALKQAAEDREGWRHRERMSMKKHPEATQTLHAGCAKLQAFSISRYLTFLLEEIASSFHHDLGSQFTSQINSYLNFGLI